MGWLVDRDEKSVLTLPADARSRSFKESDAVLPIPDWAQSLNLIAGKLFDWLLG